MNEQLYSIWYDEYERWARIQKPEKLRIKYNSSGFSDVILFASLEDITDWFNSLSDSDRFRFSIRPLKYARATEHRRLDKQKRQSHALKYL